MKLFKTAALAVAVSMIGLSVVGDAGATSPIAFTDTYYSDATYTTVVGHWNYDCFHTVKTGTITAYQIHVDVEECP